MGNWDPCLLFFHFHDFFAEMFSSNRLAPSASTVGPVGNPGSTTHVGKLDCPCCVGFVIGSVVVWREKFNVRLGTVRSFSLPSDLEIVY